MRINKSLITNQFTGAGTGSVTSVAMTVPTGFAISGTPITSSGTLALTFSSGYALPPSQTGNSGKYLTTDGTNMSWGTISGAVSGTANYLSYFATSTTLGTSPIYYDGSYYLNIGTTTSGTGRFQIYNLLADTHLQLSGNAPSLRITDTPTSATYNLVVGLASSANSFITNTVAGDMAIANASGGSILFGITGTEAMRVFTTSGNVSIGGNSTDSGFKLAVSGDARINSIRVGRGNANDSQSVAVGVSALNSVTLAGANVAIGYLSLSTQNTGYRNTAIGASSGANVTTGIQNVFIGSRAGGSVTTGSNNIHIGYTAGSLGLTTGSYNVIIGSNLSGITTTLSNNIIIADGQGQQRINVVSNGSVGIGTGTIISTSARFQIDSTTQGFLPPRMTGAQAEAISSPAAGLMVYANSGNGTTITSIGWWGFDGTNWVKIN